MESQDQLLRRVRRELQIAQESIFRMMGCSEAECVSMATEAVERMGQEAMQRATKRTADLFSTGLGKEMLASEKSNPKNHAAFEKRRAEGVTNADIEQWWNLSVFEQELFMVEDEQARMAMFLFLREKGLPPEKASVEVFKLHVKWGDPYSGSGDDRPIYPEMKFRILQFTEKLQANPEEMHRRFQASTSLNALVRSEMRNGRL